jgi:hypothetical protein
MCAVRAFILLERCARINVYERGSAHPALHSETRRTCVGEVNLFARHLRRRRPVRRVGVLFAG